MPEPAETTRETLLVLGGTADANALVGRISGCRPAARTILSLAGRTSSPKIPPACELRIGGFGGVDGLAQFLKTEGVTALFDATHPFAARISANAERAADKAGIPRIALARPAWSREPGDDWRRVETIEKAAQALPPGARPFLALGRQHLGAFAGRSDLGTVVRMIDPPAMPMPFDAEIILGRPSPDPTEEAALFEARAVTHLVCRNSGGTAAYAKVAAARRLGLPVVMIDRPPSPGHPIAETIDDVFAWLEANP